MLLDDNTEISKYSHCYTTIYNVAKFAKLRKAKNKYTIQLFKVESPLHKLSW